MSGLLSRISLKLQVALLSIVAILGIGAIGGIYTLGRSALVRHEATAETAVSMASATQQVRQALSRMREAEKSFLLQREERFVVSYATSAQAFEARIARLAEGLPRLGVVDAAARLTAIGSGFRDYRTLFERTVEIQQALGLDETKGLEGTLRASVHAIETTLKEADAIELTASMLTLRRHEKDFMLRGAARYVSELDKTAGSFLKLLDKSTLSAAAVERIRKQLADYRRDFRSYADAKLALAEMARAMTVAVESLEAAADGLSRTVDAAEATARDDAARSRVETDRDMWFAMGATFVLVVVAGLLLGRAISVPILALDGAVARLSRGELETAIPGGTRRDEVGGMARAVEVFKVALLEKRSAEAAAALDSEARMRRVERVDALTRAFDQGMAGLTQGLRAAALQMEETAQSMTVIARRTTGRSGEVASAAEETSENVRTVAAATEELAISVREIGGQVAQSDAMAQRAVEMARRTDDTVRDLAEGSRRIGDVVQLIGSVAAQTNLLALNATIEAARAGEAGRGFAVVAQEVKDLAAQTTRATEQITTQISAIQASTEGVVTDVRNIGQVIADMSAITAAIAAAIEEQGAATQEIARNVQAAAQGTAEVTGSMTEVRDGAVETDSAARQVLDAAEVLSRDAQTIGLEVAAFLADVKAA